RCPRCRSLLLLVLPSFAAAVPLSRRFRQARCVALATAYSVRSLRPPQGTNTRTRSPLACRKNAPGRASSCGARQGAAARPGGLPPGSLCEPGQSLQAGSAVAWSGSSWAFFGLSLHSTELRKVRTCLYRTRPAEHVLDNLGRLKSRPKVRETLPCLG